MSTMSDEQLARVLATQNSNVKIEEMPDLVSESDDENEEVENNKQDNSYEVEPITKVDDQTGVTEDASAVVNSVLGNQTADNVDLVPVQVGAYNKFKNCCYHKCPGKPGKKKPRPCMMCAKVLYCCRECQTGDMQRHKKECEGRKPKPKTK